MWIGLLYKLWTNELISTTSAHFFRKTNHFNRRCSKWHSLPSADTNGQKKQQKRTKFNKIRTNDRIFIIADARLVKIWLLSSPSRSSWIIWTVQDTNGETLFCWRSLMISVVIKQFGVYVAHLTRELENRFKWKIMAAKAGL